MAQLTLTVRVIRPWWFVPAFWIAAMPMLVRCLLRRSEPSEAEADAHAERCARWLKFDVI